MTSPSSTRSGAAGPGDRPHLPPVAPSSRRTARKAPMAWLPWLLAGLLLLTLLAAALLARAAGGSGTDGGTDGGSTAGGAAVEQPSDAEGQASGGQAAAPGGEAGTGALTAGGQDLLTRTGEGELAALVGEQAQGTATVESVVADEGFWVGESAESRVFVYLTPEARQSAGESGFQVEAGQTVRLAGSVRASSPELALSLGVTADEGADQLAQQGAFVEATEVALAD